MQTSSYREHKWTAGAVSEGDLLATYSARKTEPTFRKVTRTSDHEDGTVSIYTTGRLTPQRLARATPVVVRVRRRR